MDWNLEGPLYNHNNTITKAVSRSEENYNLTTISLPPVIFDKTQLGPPLFLQTQPPILQRSRYEDVDVGNLRNEYPSKEAFDRVTEEYINNLNVKKQKKALLDREMHNKIIMALKNREHRIDTPQFRFWTRKMFHLVKYRDLPSYLFTNTNPDDYHIMHNNLPVAIREDIHSILIFCHESAGHGGRDKTMTQVRRIFTWIPKDLITRFIRICPTCEKRDKKRKLSRQPIKVKRASPSPSLQDHQHKPLHAQSFRAQLHTPPPSTSSAYLDNSLSQSVSSTSSTLSITSVTTPTIFGSPDYFDQQYFPSTSEKSYQILTLPEVTESLNQSFLPHYQQPQYDIFDFTKNL